MNNIVDMLNQNNIPCHAIQNYTGNCDVSCSHNLNEYRITKDGAEYKLLEINHANNRSRKNKYYLAFKNRDEKKAVEFIVTRK